MIQKKTCYDFCHHKSILFCSADLVSSPPQIFLEYLNSLRNMSGYIAKWLVNAFTLIQLTIALDWKSGIWDELSWMCGTLPVLSQHHPVSFPSEQSLAVSNITYFLWRLLVLSKKWCPFATVEKVYSTNVCSLNVIWMYYIDHVVNVMWPASISCVTCPVASWDTEGCALHNLGGSSRPFRYPIHTVLYCKYGNATLLAYGFSLTIVENFECSLSLEETWMKERLFQSLCDFINLLGGCNDSQFLPWGGELHHLMDLVCFWASYMLEERQPPSPKNSQLTQTPLSPTYSLTVVFCFFSSQCVGL